MSELNWGLSLSLSGDLADPAVVAQVAASAEEAGWDGVFCWDHLWNRTGVPFADPWVTMAAIAVATDRARLGPLVTPLPRRRPQVVAQQAATLDRLSEGRLILGLGLGHDGYGEFSTFDEPLLTPRARAGALDEGLTLVTDALTGVSSPRADARPTTISCRQGPRCPIWVAGRPDNPAGARRAARHGIEGVALVGVEQWLPQHASQALRSGGFAPGDIDVALVGGAHPNPAALAEAGATWAVPELMPGTTRAEALAAAAKTRQ